MHLDMQSLAIEEINIDCNEYTEVDWPVCSARPEFLARQYSGSMQNLGGRTAACDNAGQHLSTGVDVTCSRHHSESTVSTEQLLGNAC